MKYIVVANTGYLLFSEEVNKKLEEGWELTGGASIAFNGAGSTLFVQAMTKLK